MKGASSARAVAEWLCIGMGAAAASYCAYVTTTWCRYGRTSVPNSEDRDPLLDRFMPLYEVVERHHVRVAAPAAVTISAAREMDLRASFIVRTIFRSRELILGATPDGRVRPHGLLAEMQALGWGVLADVPGREIVVGAVTRPWQANVTFRGLPPDQFLAFAEPDYVKIAWTLRADPIDATASILRTETRAIATDAGARRKFRWYWSFLSPGIRMIRRVSFGPAKREAEHRAASA